MSNPYLDTPEPAAANPYLDTATDNPYLDAAPSQGLSLAGQSFTNPDLAADDISGLQNFQQIPGGGVARLQSPGNSAGIVSSLPIRTDTVPHALADSVMLVPGGAGRILGAAAGDAGATLGALAAREPGQIGELGGNLFEMGGEGSGRNLQAETVEEVSKTNPYLATTSKIAQGTVESVPLIVATPGGPIGRLIALGFSADMIANAGHAATTLGDELGKPVKERNMDRITSAAAEIIQSTAFAPTMAAHGAGDFIGERATQFTKKQQAVKELANHLKTAEFDGEIPKHETAKAVGQVLEQVKADEPNPYEEAKVPEIAGEGVESNESIQARTTPGESFNQASAERAKKTTELAKSLQPGDVIIDEDGVERTVRQVLSDGSIFASKESGDKTGAEYHLSPGDKIRRKTAPAGSIVDDIATQKLDTERRVADVASQEPLTKQDLSDAINSLREDLLKRQVVKEAEAPAPELEALPAAEELPPLPTRLAEPETAPVAESKAEVEPTESPAAPSRADAQLFDKLVKEYGPLPELGWATGDELYYNSLLDAKDHISHGIGAKVKAHEQFKRARAMAVGDLTQDRAERRLIETAEGRAQLLPKLIAHLREKLPEERGIDEMVRLHEFKRNDRESTPTERTERDTQDADTVRAIVARNPQNPDFAGIQAVGSRTRRGWDKLAVQERGSSRQALPERVQKLVENAFGVRIIHVEKPGGDVPFNGVRVGDRKTILLATDAQHPVLAVTFHEILHHIQKENPPLFRQMRAQLEPLMRGVDEYRERMRRRDYENTNDEAVHSEIMADFIGDQAMRPEFWEDLAAREPDVFKKFGNAVLRWIDKVLSKITGIKDFGSDRHISDLKQARRVVTDALAKFAGDKVRGREVEPETVESNEPFSRKIVDPEQRSRFEDAIGSFDDDGALKAVKNNGGDFLNHSADGVLGFNSWRYDAKSKTVGWWGGIPDERFQEAVKNWLEKRGFQVEKNTRVGYNAGKHESYFSKKDGEPDFFTAPESVADQKARLAAEEAKAKARDQREAMLTRADARLTGEDLDTTGDLLAGDAGSRVDKSGQGSFFSRKEDKPLWRSNIEDALQSWQNKGTPEQLRAHLAKTRGAMDEAEWIGLDDFLKDRPSVTKAEVADFVAKNKVDVQEVVKDDGARMSRERFDQLSPEEQDRLAESNRNTKFHQYQLPGGENYRELLLTLPTDQNRARAQHSERIKEMIFQRDKARVALERYPNAPADDRANLEREVRNYDTQINMAMRAKPEDRGAFRSSHFDEPNILAHVRFNERTDADGKRVLHLEEVQSDWHQKGRKEGYSGDALKKRLAEIVREREALVERAKPYTDKGKDAPLEILDAYASLGDEQMRLERQKGSGVPDAPFKQTWPMLAMKRMIRYAAENGFDRITWTTGEQQAARYDLSKQVSKIRYSKDGADYWLTVDGNRGEQIFHELTPAAKLEGIVGKEIAEKIVRGDGEPEESTGATVLRGLNLKVGGEGMKGFYDKILPSEVNKYAKKWGGRVAPGDIVTKKGGQGLSGGGVPETVKDGFKTVREATAWKDEHYPDGLVLVDRTPAGKPQGYRVVEAQQRDTTAPVHSIDITPAMRDAAMEGMPMFSRKESPEDYRELLTKYQDAGKEVERLIKLSGNREAIEKAGITKAEAKAELNLAVARANGLRDALKNHPGYVSDLLAESKRLAQELNRTDLTPEEHATLETDFEQIRADIEKLPKKLVARVMDERFLAGDQTGQEQAAGAEHPGAQPAIVPPSSGAEVAPDFPSEKYRKAFKAMPQTLREAKTAAMGARKKIAAMWDTRENRDVMQSTYDAAQNSGQIFGKQAANEVLNTLNRSFNAPAERVTARNPLREHALTFVVESGRDLDTLADFRRVIEASDFGTTAKAKQALEAINYAETHWDRMQPAAELYNRITDAQVAHENSAGVDTLHRDGGYVFHLEDLSSDSPMDAAGGGGASSSFLKVRQHPTYADAIAAGVTPKSLNAVDLMQRRMSMGQTLINHGAWIDGMRRVIDPTTQKPIVTSLVSTTRRDGKVMTSPPPGYTAVEYASFAVLNGYDGLFKSLVTPSHLRNSVIGNIALDTAGALKHSMLVFDSYHLGRLAFWNAMARGDMKAFAHKMGKTLLDYSTPEIQRMIANGEVPKAWETDLLESKRQLNLLLKHGLNVGSVADNIAPPFLDKIPVLGWVAAPFNKFLFEKFQRGAMAEAGLIELRRQMKMNPGATEAQLARKVALDLNKRFGNLQSQSVLAPLGKTVQDIMRMVMLAPQWNESLIRSELSGYQQVGSSVKSALLGDKDASGERQRRAQIGMLGRTAATAIVGSIVANQIINYITRGHSTFQNPEETEAAKISAYIPDVVGNSPGFFLNPLTLPAETSELLMKKTERTGDFTQALKEYAAGRLGPLGRIPYTLMAREDEMGSKLKTGGEVLGQMASNLVPVPISGGAIARAGKQLVTGEKSEKYPGQFQRQAFQTFGVKLDSAPSEQVRMARLAADFNRHSDDFKALTYQQKRDEFMANKSHGEFYDLDTALATGNQKAIQDAITEIRAKRDDKFIREHYRTWARRPFTGSKAREAKFRDTLTPEQLDAYQKAMDAREAKRQAVVEALQQ